MRMVMIKQGTNLEGLSMQLLRRTGRGETSIVEKLKALNPHVDFQRLTAGTVLLVPDSPELKTGASSAVGDDVLADFVNEVDKSLDKVMRQVRAGFEQEGADRIAVTAALKTAAIKRLVDSDAALKKQLQDADATFKSDQKRAGETLARLADVQKLAASELTTLRKSFER